MQPSVFVYTIIARVTFGSEVNNCLLLLSRYHDDPDDGYRQDPGDRYDDQPPNQSFNNLHGNSYPDKLQHGYPDDSFPEDAGVRRHEGLPLVQDDPFADDPFKQKQRSLLQLQQEDPYPRGPSPGAGSDRMGK